MEQKYDYSVRCPQDSRTDGHIMPKIAVYIVLSSLLMIPFGTNPYTEIFLPNPFFSSRSA